SAQEIGPNAPARPTGRQEAARPAAADSRRTSGAPRTAETCNPGLQSERLVVRDLTARDLDAVHALLDVDLRWEHRSRADRARWLDWTIADYKQRALVHQPPYGEYAVELVEAGRVIGLVGLVPSLMPFGLLPGDRAHGIENTPFAVPEVGLFWAI